MNTKEIYLKCKDVRSFNKFLKSHGLSRFYRVERLRYWRDPRPIYGLWYSSEGDKNWKLLYHSPSLKELGWQLSNFYYRKKGGKSNAVKRYDP